MQTLSYQTLADNHYSGYLLKTAPERVLQFGEGNFLRAFVDYFIDMMNEKAGFDTKVVLAQPIAPGLAPMINAQEGLYTLLLRGSENGRAVDDRRVISCVSRCLNPYEDYAALLAVAHNPDLRYIVSNTTEAGIIYDPASHFEDTPPASFPAKLTRFLYERYTAFSGAADKGLVILSCELIDNNGKELAACVDRHIADWALPAGFAAWVKASCIFCSTLVDRIVPGRIRDAAAVAKLEEELGYHDQLLDVGEVFGFWVIEGPQSLADELPFAKAGLPVIFTDDVTPYKKRKVRILNGAHTSMVLGAYLAGQNIVRNCMQDEVIRGFMNKAIYEEIIPTLPLPRAELDEFAAAVADRFNNPFVDHELLSISLNSTSKWRARVQPSLEGYIEAKGALPRCLTMSLAALIAFYGCHIESKEENALCCRRPAGDAYKVLDDAWVLDFYWQHKDDAPAALAEAVLKNTEMWGRDLTELPGFAAAVEADLALILEKGAYEAYKSCL